MYAKNLDRELIRYVESVPEPNSKIKTALGRVDEVLKNPTYHIFLYASPKLIC